MSDIRDRGLKEILDPGRRCRAEASTEVKRTLSPITWLRVACVAYGARLAAYFAAPRHK